MGFLSVAVGLYILVDSVWGSQFIPEMTALQTPGRHLGIALMVLGVLALIGSLGCAKCRKVFCILLQCVSGVVLALLVAAEVLVLWSAFTSGMDLKGPVMQVGTNAVIWLAVAIIVALPIYSVVRSMRMLQSAEMNAYLQEK
jgi:hypothetical protein